MKKQIFYGKIKKKTPRGATMYITDDIKYIGVNDAKKDLFEGQYRIPSGISYNSYIIMDEKIAVFDTVKVAYIVRVSLSVNMM